VIGVFVRDHDGNGVRGVRQRCRERTRVNEELLSGVFKEQGSVFELGESHDSELIPDCSASQLEANTPVEANARAKLGHNQEL
jgi:hypothetical protein